MAVVLSVMTKNLPVLRYGTNKETLNLDLFVDISKCAAVA